MSIIFKFGETYYLYALGGAAIIFYVYTLAFSMNWIGRHAGHKYVGMDANTYIVW